MRTQSSKSRIASGTTGSSGLRAQLHGHEYLADRDLGARRTGILGACCRDLVHAPGRDRSVFSWPQAPLRGLPQPPSRRTPKTDSSTRRRTWWRSSTRRTKTRTVQQLCDGAYRDSTAAAHLW